MAFHYSLEALLRVRQIHERREEEMLGAIISKISAVQMQIENAREALLDSRRLLLQNMADGVAGSELQFAANCDAGRAFYLEMLQNHLQQLEKQRVEQGKIYREARQRREVLESYRERQLQIYNQEQSRREQQRVDDLFLVRLGHSRKT
jgi:flagellar export protein FliJ